MKINKKFLLMLVAAVFIVSLVPAISFAASATSLEKTDDGSVKIASKAKVAKYKVTWNGNGGKIGSKKTVATSVKKGSKLAKLAKSPKRSGYTFKGWYTKKSGGTKITKNTKPKKSVTYFAHWKKAKALNAQEKKLVGTWESTWDGSARYQFNADGTYNYVADIKVFNSHSYWWGEKGHYSVKNGKLVEKYQYTRDYNTVLVFSNAIWSNWETSERSLKFYTEDGKQYMELYGGALTFQKVS
ncbi:MAG: InlB B-repeat-containing protein [Methanobrevibacter sp.]|nr:InlB B-repeat-containing protein [Methanobrevibacter sp.]